MQKPPPFVLTEAVHTTAVAPPNTPIIRGTSPTLPHSGMFGIPHNVVANSREFTAHSMKTAREFQTLTEQLAQSIEQDLAATRSEGQTHSVPPVEAITRELGVRHTLISRKTAELHQKTALAHQFFGDNPLNKDFHAYYKKAQSMDSNVRPRGLAMQAWATSYRAAHEANLLSQSIAMLNQQQVEVHKWLALAQASDQAQAAAVEAQRLAAENARIAAEQKRQRDLVEAARREQEQVRAREQARMPILTKPQHENAHLAYVMAEMARKTVQAKAAEQARLKAQAESRHPAEAEKERFEREQLAQQRARERAREKRLIEEQAFDRRNTEKARRERLLRAELDAQKKRRQQTLLDASGDAERYAEQARLKILRQAQTEARWHNPVFANIGSAAAYGPTFTGTLGNIANSPLSAHALRVALRTAVSIALTSLSSAAVGFAALLIPSELGNGDLFSASVPLSELAPDLDADLYELATAGAEVDLPVRLGSRTSGNRVEVVVVSTDGVTVPSKVPVVLARFDAQKNIYVSSATSTESKGPVVTWTPLVKPLNPSTDLPVADTDLPIYEGADVTLDSGRIDPFPQLDQYGFGGWVTVFPIDSGIPPIFTMFRDRRQDPGIASGMGQTVSSNWLGAAATPQGAPIPMQIADKLRGREFSSFRAFRRAFWKAVGNEKALFDQFSRLNKTDLRDGLAPSASPSEQAGKRKKFEIHHIKPISEGGAVYDVTNLTVLTPKQHIELHSKGGM